MIAKLLFRSLLAGLCATSGSLHAASAPSQKKAAATAPRLQVDSTPIEAKPGVVLSYADVVEPVQKAVVAIYSTRIVRERVVTNPLFRQIGEPRWFSFPDVLKSAERVIAKQVASRTGYYARNRIDDAIKVVVRTRGAVEQNRKKVA